VILNRSKFLIIVLFKRNGKPWWIFHNDAAKIAEKYHFVHKAPFWIAFSGTFRGPWLDLLAVREFGCAFYSRGCQLATLQETGITWRTTICRTGCMCQLTARRTEWTEQHRSNQTGRTKDAVQQGRVTCENLQIDQITMVSSNIMRQRTQKKVIPLKRSDYWSIGKRKIPISNSFRWMPKKRGGSSDGRMEMQQNRKLLEDMNSWLRNRENRINALLSFSQY
jgi:hypothetical protein